MKTAESKAICTLLTGEIFLLLIQAGVHEAYAHVYHLVIHILDRQRKWCKAIPLCTHPFQNLSALSC